MFSCRDGKGSELSSQASKMLYKPPGAVYIASYKEPLDQSDCWKLFVQLWNYTKDYYMLRAWYRCYFILIPYRSLARLARSRYGIKNIVNRNDFVSGIIRHYYTATMIRALWLAAERALSSCSDRALWSFFSARRLFWVVSKTTCAWAKTTKKMTKYNYVFNNWRKN